MPVHYQLVVNQENSPANISKSHLAADIVEVNTQDTERFNSLFDLSLFTVDASAPSLKKLQAYKLFIPEHEPYKQVRTEDTNCTHLGVKSKNL